MFRYNDFIEKYIFQAWEVLYTHERDTYQNVASEKTELHLLVI